MTKAELMEDIEKAIAGKNFTQLEIDAFKANPWLALIAGALIGHNLGIVHCVRLAKERSKE